VTLVEYGDYECPHCGMAHPLVKRLQQRLGGLLRFVFRNFPFSKLQPHAVHAAEMAEGAALRGRFWEMHDTLFEHRDALTKDDLMSYAAKLRAAAKIGILTGSVIAAALGILVLVSSPPPRKPTEVIPVTINWRTPAAMAPAMPLGALAHLSTRPATMAARTNFWSDEASVSWVNISNTSRNG
jgi:hypothetical protein